MNLQNWKAQLRKGLLDLCVVNFLQRREYYGYDLVQDLKQINGLRMREGNIYPILARLEEDGLVTSQVRPSNSGPPRKYFRITKTGEELLQEMNEHWEEMELAVKSARKANKGGKR